MYEIGEYLNRKRNFSTAILKCPNGRYTLVGSVPVELCHPAKNSLTPGLMNPNVYATEQEVIEALLQIGITHFQRANCSWYDQEEVTK